jgi:WD40 repeat protein
MIRSRYCLCVLCAILGASLALTALLFFAPAPALAQAPKGPVSFINDVAPILKENCFACHDAKKRKGKFDMTTYENMRKGGEKEEAIIVDGKPDESALYDRLIATTAARMPPKESGDPLPKAKIAIIKRWIEEGGKLDGGIEAKADLMRELRIRWKPPAPPVAYKYPVIVNAVCFTPDNAKVIVGGHHELTIWDVDQAKLEKRIATRAERAYAMAFLPDGKLVVAGGRPGQEGNVRVYDINAKPKEEKDGVAMLDGVNDKAVMLTELADTDDAILCLSISADGKRLAAGGCDRLVRVWDISEGIDKAKLDQTCENHADWVLGIALAPDGKHMLTCSRDKTAKVWDLSTKESVLTFPGHQASVFGVAVKPDSKVGYSVGEDNQVRAWTASGDGKAVGAAAGGAKGILKITLNPAGTMLVTCGGDNAVRTWTIGGNGAPAAGKTFSGHTDQVFAVAVSPDGKRVASGSYNGEVKIWNVEDPKEVKAVKEFNASPGLQQAAAPQK